MPPLAGSAFYSAKNLHEIINTLNTELSKLTEWLLANQLTINLKKTHYIIFSNSTIHQGNHPNITINSQTIDRVAFTRFLGVMIDENLKYKEHIRYIKTKCAKGVGILCRAKKYFTIKTLTDLYYAFIHPYLNYCIEIWGNTCTTYLTPIIRLQKTAVRIIVGARRRQSSEGIFKLLRIIPVEKLHTYSIYIFLFKLISNTMPQSISSTFQFNNNLHSHSTRQNNNLHIDSVTFPIRKRSLHYQASILYNCDDALLYNLPYVSFKFMIKSRLLDM